MRREELQVLREDIIYFEKRHTFIEQLPYEMKLMLINALEWWKQITNDDIDIYECMNEKLWCAIDWLDYILDNAQFED